MVLVLSWLITVLVVVLLATFAWALISLRHIPVGRRPVTKMYDRFGDVIGMTENPDFHENFPEPSEENPNAHPPEGDGGQEAGAAPAI